MQRALQKTLSLLGEPSRDAVLSYLQKYHNISFDNTSTFTQEKLGSALDTIFGSGQQVLMRRFEDEVRKARLSTIRKEPDREITKGNSTV
ncbi:MAG: hypothetical protein ABI361_00905 [Nitrososphaera sp.]|jgi:hypothetical protein